MLPLRCTVASEIISKFCDINPMENALRCARSFGRRPPPIAGPAKCFRAVPYRHSDAKSHPNLRARSAQLLRRQERLNCFRRSGGRRIAFSGPDVNDLAHLRAFSMGFLSQDLEKISDATVHRSGDMGRLEKIWPDQRSAGGGDRRK